MRLKDKVAIITGGSRRMVGEKMQHGAIAAYYAEEYLAEAVIN